MDIMIVHCASCIVIHAKVADRKGICQIGRLREIQKDLVTSQETCKSTNEYRCRDSSFVTNRRTRKSSGVFSSENIKVLVAGITPRP